VQRLWIVRVSRVIDKVLRPVRLAVSDLVDQIHGDLARGIRTEHGLKIICGV
jgi:hypothetical protein